MKFSPASIGSTFWLMKRGVFSEYIPIPKTGMLVDYPVASGHTQTRNDLSALCFRALLNSKLNR